MSRAVPQKLKRSQNFKHLVIYNGGKMSELVSPQPTEPTKPSFDTGEIVIGEEVEGVENVDYKQQRELFEELSILDHSDERWVAIRNKLIALNKPLIGKVINKYYSSYEGKNAEYIHSYGLDGLMLAVEGYDLSRGYEFSTYAWRCIQHHIYKQLGIEANAIRVPDRTREAISKLYKFGTTFEQRYGRLPSEAEKARYLKEVLSSSAVEAMRCQHFNDQVSLDDGAFSDVDSGHMETSAITLGETIPSKEPNPANAVVDEDEVDRAMELLAELEPRQRDIIEARFGLQSDDHSPKTYEEIAGRYNLSRQRIREIEKKALLKLQQLAAVRFK